VNVTFNSTQLDPTFFPRTKYLFFYASIISPICVVRHTPAALRLGGKSSRGIPREKKTTIGFCLILRQKYKEIKV